MWQALCSMRHHVRSLQYTSWTMKPWPGYHNCNMGMNTAFRLRLSDLTHTGNLVPHGPQERSVPFRGNTSRNCRLLVYIKKRRNKDIINNISKLLLCSYDEFRTGQCHRDEQKHRVGCLIFQGLFIIRNSMALPRCQASLQMLYRYQFS